MTVTNHPMPNEARTQATNWLPLLTLLVLVIPLRGWLMWNTEVLAHDSVVYINYAMQLEQQFLERSPGEEPSASRLSPEHLGGVGPGALPGSGRPTAFTMQLSATCQQPGRRAADLSHVFSRQVLLRTPSRLLGNFAVSVSAG